jgi:hypothetical protein
LLDLFAALRQQIGGVDEAEDRFFGEGRSAEQGKHSRKRGNACLPAGVRRHSRARAADTTTLFAARSR